MLHGTIRNDDFLRNKELVCWNNVVTIRNNSLSYFKSLLVTRL